MTNLFTQTVELNWNFKIGALLENHIKVNVEEFVAVGAGVSSALMQDLVENGNGQCSIAMCQKVSFVNLSN